MTLSRFGLYLSIAVSAFFVSCFSFGQSVSELKSLDRAGFHNAQQISLSLKPRVSSDIKYSHQIEITPIVFRDTSWTAEIVEVSLSRVAEVYSQCGIKILAPTLFLVDALNNKTDLTMEQEQEVVNAMPLKQRPLIYFLNGFEDGSPAHAYGIDNCKDTPLKCNSAWISRYVKSDYYKELRDPNYSPIAHELAHILGNRGHVSEVKNILADTPDLVNDQITEEQCQAFKKFPTTIKIQATY